MKLFGFYRKAVIYPSLFILFYGIVYQLIDNYKSGSLVSNQIAIISIITAVLYSLVMCILSLPIFLNKWQKLNKNLLWNIITWFFLPFGYMIVFLTHDIQKRINYEFGFGNNFIHLLIMTIPFVIGLSATFIQYRQTMTGQDINQRI